MVLGLWATIHDDIDTVFLCLRCGDVVSYPKLHPVRRIKMRIRIKMRMKRVI